MCAIKLKHADFLIFTLFIYIKIAHYQGVCARKTAFLDEIFAKLKINLFLCIRFLIRNYL